MLKRGLGPDEDSRVTDRGLSAARIVLQRKIGATTSDRRESYRDLVT